MKLNSGMLTRLNNYKEYQYYDQAVDDILNLARDENYDILYVPLHTGDISIHIETHNIEANLSNYFILNEWNEYKRNFKSINDII